MSRYRIAYYNDDTLLPLVVHCDGDCLAHHIANALRVQGWAVEITKEGESCTVAQDNPNSPFGK